MLPIKKFDKNESSSRILYVILPITFSKSFLVRLISILKRVSLLTCLSVLCHLLKPQLEDVGESYIGLHEDRASLVLIMTFQL